MIVDSLERQNVKWLRRPTLFMANAWYLLAVAGLYVLPWMLDTIASFVRTQTGLTFPVDGMVTILYNLCLLALPVLFYAVDKPGIGESMRVRAPKFMAWPLTVAAAMVGAVFAGCIDGWWRMLLERAGGVLSKQGMPMPENAGQLITMIAIYCALPAVCEELMFRGALLGAWERRGTVKAVCVTGTLFCLLHGSISGLPVQLMMGFVLGFLVVSTDSLWIGMTFHLVYNASALCIGFWVPPVEGLLWKLMLTVGSAALFGALLYLLMGRRGKPIEQVGSGDPNPMEWEELLVFLIGMMTVAVRYGQDFLRICNM